MNSCIALSALVTLLVQAPDKLFADGAEGRLREECGAKLVTFDNMNFGLFDGTSPLMEGEQTLSLKFGLLVSLILTSRI